MVELDQFKAILNSYAKPLVEVRDSLDLANKEKRIEELERKMEEPDFWDNPERSQEMMKELKSLKDDKEIYENLESQRDDMETLIEMGYEEDDASVIPEIQEILDQFEADFENIRMKTLLSGEYDKKDAIIKLNAGAGGTESCDWAGMLYRMYTRWAEKKGFTLEVLDYLDGDEAGIKSVTFEVHGENAYGYLKSEKGVHRLVRISPFNAAGKRQTSFVSCDVMPDIDEDLDVDIKEDDLRIDTYRSSGAGGQHINKTSSAVRMTHLPTGIVVSMQDQRSQQQNRAKAMEILRARVYDYYQSREQNEYDAERKSAVGTGDRSERIRTYNFPQNRVTDHRIGLTLNKLDRVMNGELDEVIDALVLADQAEKMERLTNE